MSILENLTLKQEKIIEEFKIRVKDVVTPAITDDPFMYYRFLKARDFDVDRAEKMLRKHISWRKVHQVDTILEDFKPTEFFHKFPEPSLIAYDKEGSMVRYSPTGKFCPYEVLKCVKLNNFMKQWYWFAEYSIQILKAENKRAGKNAYQAVMIFDLEKLSFANATSKVASEMFLLFINEYQDNYPERMKSTYVINAPAYYVIVFSILKTIMSSAMLKKIHVFGHSGWKEKLLEIIDADALPAFLGGNRTDPDGDPLCRSSVNHGGPIPEYYFLTDEERYFKDRTQVQVAIVLPREKKMVDVEVEVVGTVIEWEFLAQSKDIGFGLFFEESENNIREIVPIHKFTTPDGTVRDIHRCRFTGRYILIFDNTYSWRSAKEVQYCIRTVIPDP